LHKSLDYEKLDFSNRFRHFIEQDTKMAVLLLNNIISDDLNQQGERILKDLSAVLDISTINSSNYDLKNLFLVLVSLNPKIAYNQEFWINNQNDHREIISTLLRSESKSQIDWQKIIGNLIEADSNINPDLFQRYDLKISDHILKWVNKLGNRNLPNNWINYLRNHPEDIVRWLSDGNTVKTNTLTLILPMLNPNSSYVINSGTSPWQNLLMNATLANNSKCYIELQAFSLALAFNNPDQKSYRVVSTTFEDVYLALSESILDYSSWIHLESHTKTLSWWNDWDKCKKLVNALVDKSIQFAWPMHEILKHFSNKEL